MFRQGDGARVAGVARIAVLRANALGDLLLALPAMEAVKRAYPGSRLTLFGLPVDEVVEQAEDLLRAAWRQADFGRLATHGAAERAVIALLRSEGSQEG
jgi:hypothetical protein